MTEEKRSVIATDEKSKRFILAIGNQRLAFDFLTRVTELLPRTGDKPAPVLPIKRPPKLELIRGRRKKSGPRFRN